MSEITISFSCTPDQAQMLAALYAALTGDILDGSHCQIDALPKALLTIQDNLVDREVEAYAADPELEDIYQTANWGISDRAFIEAFLDLDEDETLENFVDQAMQEGEDWDEDGPDHPYTPPFPGFSLN